MPTLRALECLVAVADAGSITKAARVLHSSQPAVSHQLAGLEQEARTALLRREPRGVRLTPAGRAALGDARRAVDAAGAALRAARAVGDAAGGTLRVACAQSLTVPFVAAVIGEWRRQRPEVSISLRESTSPDEMYAMLEAGDVDFLVRPGPADERFAVTAVADEEIVLSLPADHPLATKSAVTRQDLKGIALVGFASENGPSAWLGEALMDADVRAEIVIRTAVTSAAPQLAAAGFGAAVTPVSAVGAGFPGAVRSFRPRWLRQVVVVSDGQLSPLAKGFVQHLRTHGVQVPADVSAQLSRARPKTRR